jgi:hypothetical protein
MSNAPIVKCCTAKHTAASVMDIFKDKAAGAEVARQCDFLVSEAEGWIEAQRGDHTLARLADIVAVGLHHIHVRRWAHWSHRMWSTGTTAQYRKALGLET